MATTTVSFRQGKGNLNHNQRENISANVDIQRIKDNIVLVRKDLTEAYEEYFGAAIQEYDLKQKRADRKIGSSEEYLKKTKKSKKQQAFRECIAQVGTVQDGIDPALKALILKEYMESFADRNPNLKVFDAVIHMDEATPHLHFDFVPVIENKDAKRGLKIKNSFKAVLQGMYPDQNEMEAFKCWSERERQHIADLARSKGIDIAAKNEPKRDYLTVLEYKEALAVKNVLQAENEALEAKISQHKAHFQAEQTEYKEFKLNQEAYKERSIKELDRIDDALWVKRELLSLIEQTDPEILKKYVEDYEIEIDPVFWDVYDFCGVTEAGVDKNHKKDHQR